jgi:hypothetical protein
MGLCGHGAQRCCPTKRELADCWEARRGSGDPSSRAPQDDSAYFRGETDRWRDSSREMRAMAQSSSLRGVRS